MSQKLVTYLGGGGEGDVSISKGKSVKDLCNIYTS